MILNLYQVLSLLLNSSSPNNPFCGTGVFGAAFLREVRMFDYFSNSLSEIAGQIKKIDSQQKKITDLYKQHDNNRIYNELLKLVNTSEKFCNQVRLLPTYTGSPNSIYAVKEQIVISNNAYAEYTEEGWFHLSLPALLPRKEKGDPKYIRTIAQAVLSRFFEKKPPRKFTVPVVLIYQHCYDSSREERAYRDHDNIELNVINDLLALYCLSDDGPLKCRHYYTSKSSDSDSTEIFIVPVTEFFNWIERMDCFDPKKSC